MCGNRATSAGCVGLEAARRTAKTRLGLRAIVGKVQHTLSARPNVEWYAMCSNANSVWICSAHARTPHTI